MATGEQASAELADYLMKASEVAAVGASLGMELTHTRPGRARDDLRTRPVWALLGDLVETGEIGPWREWERVSKGRKQVGWSNGLRERFAPVLEDVSDQEIVDEVVGSADDDLVLFDLDQWRAVVGTPGLALKLVEAAEIGPGLVRLLVETEGIGCTLLGAAARARTDLSSLTWPVGRDPDGEMDDRIGGRPQSGGAAADGPRPPTIHPACHTPSVPS